MGLLTCRLNVLASVCLSCAALEQQLYDEYNRTKKGFIDTNTRMLDMARYTTLPSLRQTAQEVCNLSSI
jgi:hypothetical protein